MCLCTHLKSTLIGQLFIRIKLSRILKLKITFTLKYNYVCLKSDIHESNNEIVVNMFKSNLCLKIQSTLDNLKFTEKK